MDFVYPFYSTKSAACGVGGGTLDSLIKKERLGEQRRGKPLPYCSGIAIWAFEEGVELEEFAAEGGAVRRPFVVTGFCD